MADVEDWEKEARLVELNFRSPEDVARYGTMVRSVQENYDERLEEYLKNDFYLKLYYEWKSNSWGGSFNLLEFFRILDLLYVFITANPDKPRTIEKHLRELNYSDQQNYYLLDALTKLLAWENEKSQNLKIAMKVSHEETIRLWRNMNWQTVERFNEDFHHFNIFALQQYLAANLPDTRTKLEYLFKLKTDVQQAFPNHEHFFVNQINSEIEKLKNLQSLEQNEAQVDPSDKGRAMPAEKRMKGGTQYQNLLAIHYLLKYVKANCHNTVKARFASFLTGYSENTFRQQWSNIYQKADESGQIWETALQNVRGYFEGLGLSGVTRLIDNDLNSVREKL